MVGLESVKPLCLNADSSGGPNRGSGGRAAEISLFGTGLDAHLRYLSCSLPLWLQHGSPSPSDRAPVTELAFLERCLLTEATRLGGRVSAPTVAFSSCSVAALFRQLPLAGGRIWTWNFLGSSSSKSESLE